MVNNINKETLFCEYYKQWIEVYKKERLEMPLWQNI